MGRLRILREADPTQISDGNPFRITYLIFVDLHQGTARHFCGIV